MGDARRRGTRHHEAQHQATLPRGQAVALGFGIGFGIGYAVDWFFGTMPIFLVLFLLAGLAAGIKVMLGTAQEMQRKAAANMQGDLQKTRDDTRGDGS